MSYKRTEDGCRANDESGGSGHLANPPGHRDRTERLVGLEVTVRHEKQIREGSKQVCLV